MTEFALNTAELAQNTTVLAPRMEVSPPSTTLFAHIMNVSFHKYDCICPDKGVSALYTN